MKPLLPPGAYNPDGTPRNLSPPPRLPTGVTALDTAIQGGLPAGCLSEVSSTKPELLGALVARIAEHNDNGEFASAWVAPPGAPVDPPANPFPHPVLASFTPRNLLLLPLPDLDRESVSNVAGILTEISICPPRIGLIVLSSLSAVPAPRESLDTNSHTAHSTPAGRALDLLLAAIPNCPLLCLEPWHERGPDLPSGPPGPGVRSATSALRLRIEFSNLSPRALDLHILHDRHTGRRGIRQLLAPGASIPCTHINRNPASPPPNLKYP